MREKQQEGDSMRRILGIMCGEEKKGDCVCDRRTGFVDVVLCECVCRCKLHLALPLIPPPSPPRPPGHRISAAGSAGDTRQTPDPLSARSSWPETIREGDTEEKGVCVAAGGAGGAQ